MYNSFYPYSSPMGIQPNGIGMGFAPNGMQYATQSQGTPFGQQSFQQNVNTNKIFVNGIEDVRNRVIPNNSDYIFLDNDQDIMYRKTADATGKTTLTCYKISLIDSNNLGQPDMSKYALKEDLEAIKKELEQQKMKSDGISGTVGMSLARSNYEER